MQHQLAPACMTVFAESPAPGVWGILRLVTASLAYRSHHPRSAKLEGAARQHLPLWWDYLSPSPFLGRWMFPMLDIPHSVSAPISYLSVCIYPVSESLLFSSITTCPNQTESKLFLSSLWNFFCIFVFMNLLYPVSPLHPVYLTPATTTPCNKQMSVFPLSPRCQLC